MPVAAPVLPMVSGPLPVHDPPALASLNVIVAPAHTLCGPEIRSGNGFTVTIAVTIHPYKDVKLMVDVPALTPVTIPVALPTLAAPPAPTLHVPLPLSVSDSDPPGHTFIVPVIAGGGRFTVTVVPAVQPVPSEYTTGAVPALRPVTMPLMLPMLAALPLILHVPPPALLLRLVVLPMHTCSTPVINAGDEFTVTV